MKENFNMVHDAIGLRNWTQLDSDARIKLATKLNIKHFPYTKWAMLPLKARIKVANYFIKLNSKNLCNLRP